MGKIENIISARMAEASQQAAKSTKTAALAELHALAISMSKIADQVGDRLAEMERQVRMLNAPHPPRTKPQPVLLHRQPVLLLQVAVVLMVMLLISNAIFAFWPQQMACQPTKKPGVMICKKI